MIQAKQNNLSRDLDKLPSNEKSNISIHKKMSKLVHFFNRKQNISIQQQQQTFLSPEARNVNQIKQTK